MTKCDSLIARKAKLERNKRLALARWEFDVKCCRTKEELRLEVALLTAELDFVKTKLEIARNRLMPWLKCELRL